MAATRQRSSRNEVFQRNDRSRLRFARDTPVDRNLNEEELVHPAIYFRSRKFADIFYLKTRNPRRNFAFVGNERWLKSFSPPSRKLTFRFESNDETDFQLPQNSFRLFISLDSFLSVPLVNDRSRIVTLSDLSTWRVTRRRKKAETRRRYTSRLGRVPRRVAVSEVQLRFSYALFFRRGEEEGEAYKASRADF